jgi:hypothetical protein
MGALRPVADLASQRDRVIGRFQTNIDGASLTLRNPDRSVDLIAGV